MQKEVKIVIKNLHVQTSLGIQDKAFSHKELKDSKSVWITASHCSLANHNLADEGKVTTIWWTNEQATSERL